LIKKDQNKTNYFIIKVSGRDGLERIIPTPAESEDKLSRKERRNAQISKSKNKVDIQFGDGPILTLDLDGSIQPREEAGIGPEMAAIASSLNVYEASPSGIDEHVSQLSETVSADVRSRGGRHPSETVSQMLGVDSLKLAQDSPNQWKQNQAFRKRTHKRSGLDQPSQKQMVRGVVQRKSKRDKNLKKAQSTSQIRKIYPSIIASSNHCSKGQTHPIARAICLKAQEATPL
jgi:hypothetical protein